MKRVELAEEGQKENNAGYILFEVLVNVYVDWFAAAVERKDVAKGLEQVSSIATGLTQQDVDFFVCARSDGWVVEEVDKLGKQLATVQGTYDNVHARLATGRGNLVRQVETIKGLGANTKKTIATSLLENSQDDE